MSRVLAVALVVGACWTGTAPASTSPEPPARRPPPPRPRGWACDRALAELVPDPVDFTCERFYPDYESYLLCRLNELNWGEGNLRWWIHRVVSECAEDE